MMVRKNACFCFCLPALLACLAACAGQDKAELSARPIPAIDGKVSFEQAKSLLEQGKMAEAITVFRRFLRQEGPSVPVLNGLAIAHAELGRPDLAADLFAKALSIAPDDPTTLNNIGFAALRRHERGLARLYLERATEAENGAPEVGANLAMLDHLETLIDGVSSRPRDGPLPSGDTVFEIQRKDLSTFSLRGLERDQNPARPAPGPNLAPLETDLIDFSELFDPWVTGDQERVPSF